MQELRQSTEVKVRIGAAVDASDGVTPETTLTLGAADQAELLKHNGVVTVDISGRTFAVVASCDGWYDLTLTTTDTNTLGMATVVIQDSSLMAPIFKDFMITTSNYWDSKYGTDKLQVDVTEISGDSAAADNVELDYDGTGYDKSASTIGTCTTNSDMLTAAAVNAEVVDVMTIDTTAEMSQGAPPATPTIVIMLAYLYFRLRNKCTTTALEDAMWDNAGTIKLIKSTVSDDGTTLTKAEYVSGA